MESEFIEKWRPAAAQAGHPTNLRVPFDVLLTEAVAAAKFGNLYWEATERRPGLSSAGSKLPRTICEEILSLRRAVQDAQTAYLLIVDPKTDTKTLLAEGRNALSEITAVLEWHLDDGIEDEADIQLANLKANHKDDTDSAASLAQALHDYGTLAKPLNEQLQGLGNFDASLIDKALQLADQLGAVSLAPNVRSEEAKNAKYLRDQLSSLLQQKIRLVRAAARFVYRDHPEIYREVTSTYERRRRAAAKRVKQQD